MTRSADFKKLVRARMQQTGETYTAARAALLSKEATDPVHQADPEAARIARAQHEKLLRPFLRDGELVQIPSRRKARLAVLLELLSRFEPGVTYTEVEVNESLETVHEDVAYLRRELVDYGYLERDNHGAYWVTSTAPTREGNMSQETTDWERLWLPEFLAGRVR
jgi:hypothetical protein